METNDLLAIYKSNRFTFDDDSWFSLDNLDYANALGANFCVVTAFNPNNIQLHRRKNKRRNIELECELVSNFVHYTYCEVGLEEHYEDSFCIFDISLEESLAIGAKYEQYSIFYFSNGIGGYYEVATKKLIV